MIEPTTLARPYARAAFEHARAAGDLAAWQAALSELAAITAEPKVAAAMRDPNQTAAQRAATLSGLAGDAAPSAVANLLSIMADNGRLSLLPEFLRSPMLRRHLGGLPSPLRRRIALIPEGRRGPRLQQCDWFESRGSCWYPRWCGRWSSGGR